MHVAALDCVRAGVVLSNEVNPVIQQIAGLVAGAGAACVDLGLPQSALGIVGEVGGDRSGQVG